MFVALAALAQQPKFKGNLSGFIKGKLMYPAFSAQHCVQGTVNVGFKLNQKGEVTSAKINRGLIGDLDAEALRLIKLTSGKWVLPNGYDEVSTVVVPVNFRLESASCRNVTSAQMELAIADYYKEEQLTQAVYNFYKAKETDGRLASEETKILKIKEQLGIDETYLEQRLNVALKKIRQGDTAGACEDLKFIKYMGSNLANKYLEKYCK